MSTVIYSPDIVERYEFAVNQFDVRRKWVDDLQVLLLERADVESAYSKSLAKLANSFEKYSQKHSLEKGLGGILMSVRSAILTQSEQAQLQGEQLRSDAILSLKQGIKRQTEELESLRQKAEFLKTELLRNEMDLSKRKEGYYKNYKQYSKGLDAIAGVSIQASSPIGVILSENEGLMTANQTILEKSIHAYNAFLDQYFTEIVLADRLLDSMDDARINLIKDALLKSLVYEISAIKNVEYDTNQVAKKIETYKRVDMRPILVEQEKEPERTMLSKLNFNNFLAFVQNECSIPGVDRVLMAKPESFPLEFSKDINKQLKSYLELYEPKVSFKLNSPTKVMPALSFKEGEETVAQSRYYYGLLNDIFFNQQQLNPFTITKFKETIESKEKECSIFSIALHSFSLTTSDVSFKPTTQKSISDLIFFVSFVLDRCEAKKDSDLIQRIYMSFNKVCSNFLKDSPTISIYRDSLRQHNALRSREFWASDSISRIRKSLGQQSETQLSGSAIQQAFVAQLKADIGRWRCMDFTVQFQIDVLNQIADAFKIDTDTRISTHNLIMERQSLGSNSGQAQAASSSTSRSYAGESPLPSPEKQSTSRFGSSQSLEYGMIQGENNIDSDVDALGEVASKFNSLPPNASNYRPSGSINQIPHSTQKNKKSGGGNVLSSIVKEDAI